MRIRVEDPRTAADLVRYFRRLDYLAVEETPGVVEVVPITSTSERADRARTLRDLDAWRQENPGVDATPAD